MELRQVVFLSPYVCFVKLDFDHSGDLPISSGARQTPVGRHKPGTTLNSRGQLVDETHEAVVVGRRRRLAGQVSQQFVAELGAHRIYWVRLGAFRWMWSMSGVRRLSCQGRKALTCLVWGQTAADGGPEGADCLLSLFKLLLLLLLLLQAGQQVAVLHPVGQHLWRRLRQAPPSGQVGSLAEDAAVERRLPLHGRRCPGLHFVFVATNYDCDQQNGQQTRLASN